MTSLMDHSHEPTHRPDPTCPNRSRDTHTQTPPIWLATGHGSASRTVSDQTRLAHSDMHLREHVPRDLPNWHGNFNIWRPTMRAADHRSVVTQLPLTTDECFGPEGERVGMRPPLGWVVYAVY